MPPYEPLFHWTPDKLLQVRLNLDNFAFLIEDNLYWRAYLNSILVAGVSTLLCLLLPIMYLDHAQIEAAGDGEPN